MWFWGSLFSLWAPGATQLFSGSLVPSVPLVQPRQRGSFTPPDLAAENPHQSVGAVSGSCRFEREGMGPEKWLSHARMLGVWMHWMKYGEYDSPSILQTIPAIADTPESQKSWLKCQRPSVGKP